MKGETDRLHWRKDNIFCSMFMQRIIVELLIGLLYPTNTASNSAGKRQVEERIIYSSRE